MELPEWLQRQENNREGREAHINPKKDKWPQMLCVETNKMSLDVTIPREVTGDPWGQFSIGLVQDADWKDWEEAGWANGDKERLSCQELWVGLPGRIAGHFLHWSLLNSLIKTLILISLLYAFPYIQSLATENTLMQILSSLSPILCAWFWFKKLYRTIQQLYAYQVWTSKFLLKINDSYSFNKEKEMYQIHWNVSDQHIRSPDSGQISYDLRLGNLHNICRFVKKITLNISSFFKGLYQKFIKINMNNKENLSTISILLPSILIWWCHIHKHNRTECISTLNFY